jgi:hypothetical protein
MLSAWNATMSKYLRICRKAVRGRPLVDDAFNAVFIDHSCRVQAAIDLLDDYLAEIRKIEARIGRLLADRVDTNAASMALAEQKRLSVILDRMFDEPLTMVRESMRQFESRINGS